MTNFGKLILLGIVVAILGTTIFFLQKKPVEDLSNYTVNISPIVTPSAPETQTSNTYSQGDLVSFSIFPGTKMPKGILSYRGIIKGGYFFEGNIIINILDANKKVLKKSNAVAKTDWMTAGPVDFEGNVDFTGLTPGPAFFEIHNDNPSGLPQYDKSILIPIILQ